MRREYIDYINIGAIKLPSTLAEDVRSLLRDPRTGRTRHGSLQALTIQLFANWVDSQRDIEEMARARIPELPLL